MGAKGLDELEAEDTLTGVASLLLMLYVVLYIVVQWRCLVGLPSPAKRSKGSCTNRFMVEGFSEKRDDVCG